MTTVTEKFTTTSRGQLSLMEDFTFKAVFGRECMTSNRALIDLLNVILDLHGDDAIRSVVVKNPYIPGDIRITKESVLDIFTETDRHILINVEMQQKDFESYPDRNLFYGGKVIAYSSLQRGDNYDKMKKTIMIAVSHHELKLCDSCMGPSTAHKFAGIGLQLFWTATDTATASSCVHSGSWRKRPVNSSVTS